jgi:hypothetical protein
MAIQLITTKPIIERIKALKAFKFVGGAADRAVIKNFSQTVPAAYVWPETNDAEGGEFASDNSQMIRDVFTINFIVRNVRDPRGEAALEEIEALRIKVMDSLIGWVPPNGFTDFRFLRGRRVGFNDQALEWCDYFVCSRLISK